MKKLFLSLCLAIMAFNSYALTCKGQAGKNLFLEFDGDHVSGNITGYSNPMMRAPQILVQFSGVLTSTNSDLLGVEVYEVISGLTGFNATLTHYTKVDLGNCNRVSCDSGGFKSIYKIESFGNVETYECL